MDICLANREPFPVGFLEDLLLKCKYFREPCVLGHIFPGLDLQPHRPLQPWLPAEACALMKVWHPSARHQDVTTVGKGTD